MRAAALPIVATVLLASSPAHAIRPFVTDDARVVGFALAQLETWMLADRLGLDHSALVAIGPTPWLELTTGLLHGGRWHDEPRGYGVAGPILQGKALLHPAHSGRAPGVAVASGVITPWGFGAVNPVGWSGFGYLALTQSFFDDDLLIHANLGFIVAQDGSGGDWSPSAGLGVQARLVGHLCAIAEIYYGDPYAPGADHAATQVGFRYLASDRIQVDGTFGTSIGIPEGEQRPEMWGTLGLRVVTPPLWETEADEDADEPIDPAPETETTASPDATTGP